MWRRRGEAASAGLSAALYSVYSGLYSEAVVSSVASAVALAEVGQFREAVQYVQRAAKALYEGAREVFKRVKVAAQRLVELFVEAVTRVLAWVDEHKAYLFLMAAAAAGAVALSAALNLWGLVELEKLAYAASLTPFFAGRTKSGGKAAERFRSLAEWYERWRVDENVVNEVTTAPLNKERPYLKLAKSPNLPKPMAELRRALKDVKDEVERDAAVVAALVLYKTLVKNAEAYREWAGWYGWARGLVEKQEFVVTADKIRELREAHRRLEKVAEEVRRELNAVFALYALHSRELYEKLRPHLEVDLGKAEELAEARRDELSNYSDTSMGTKAYAALLSVARGGIYGHAAILLMMEGPLADVVLLTPKSAYNKADRIAKGRGEAVDPSYSGRRGRSVGQPSWKDRAASALLRYLLSRAVSEDLVFRRVEGGFETFRAYGGVETSIDVLKIGETVAYSEADEEVLRRFVEEAKRTAPDLSGFDKAPQYLEWCATDVTFIGRWIEATTAHTWQAAWYIALFGEPESSRGRANVTEEGVKLIATMYWSRDREDQILGESKWLESLLDQQVESWRQLVDAIDWRWVLKRVEEMADTLKPWIGSESANDAEREGLVRRMLGKLALFVHFAEARRGKSDDEWREERVKRLARAVEALSSRKMAGDHANELAGLIISYAESRRREIRERIYKLAEKLVGISKEEVWSVVEFVLSDMYCLARDCARNAVMRKFVAPALELIMLDKALNGKFNKEEALLYFGEMYATALAGDGHVKSGEFRLTVGGELGGGVALLRLAALLLLNQLLSDKLKFGVRVYVDKGVYHITAYGENAARLKRLLAVTAPSAGGEYLSDKFNEFAKAAKVEVRLVKNNDNKVNIRLTRGGNVAANLKISEGDTEIEYNVYLIGNVIELRFESTDRRRAELAARLLRLAGVNAEVSKVGERNAWRVAVYTDQLAAGSAELRYAIAEIVKTARDNGWMDAGKVERWLKKLESGLTLKDGWPRYSVGLTRSGALLVRFRSTSQASIEREAQRLENMELEKDWHFTVKWPEKDSNGYIYILKEGLAYAAWHSVHGPEGQRELAGEFVNYILQRAKEACGGAEQCAVYEKAEKIVEWGKKWGSLELTDIREVEVEVEGEKYVVTVTGGGAKIEGELLRLWITAVVKVKDGGAEIEGKLATTACVRGEANCNYTITYSRRGKKNEAVGRAAARADAPGGREADKRRFAAVIKALTGEEPRIIEKSDGRLEVECGRSHLDGFMLYKEFFGDIMRWLKKTSRRGRGADGRNAA